MKDLVPLLFNSIVIDYVVPLLKFIGNSVSNSKADKYSSNLDGSGSQSCYNIVNGDNSSITINIEKNKNVDVGDKKT